MDPYPSRDRPTWSAIPREDPVVVPGLDGPLSAEQVHSFERDGFVFLDGWFSEDEVGRWLDRVAGVIDELAERDPDLVVREPDSDVVRSVFRLHQLPEFSAFAAERRLAGVARQLIGTEVYVHQSRVNYKPALDGREFFWHSDFETWHIEDGMPRMRAVSASINLTASTEFNGPLMLIPGSHELYVTCVGETPELHYKQSLRRQEIGVPSRDALQMLVEKGGIVAPKGGPGSVVFFDCNTMHGSQGNLSPDPRTNLFLVFNSVDNAVVEPFGGLAPRPVHLAERTVEPLSVD